MENQPPISVSRAQVPELVDTQNIERIRQRLMEAASTPSGFDALQKAAQEISRQACSYANQYKENNAPHVWKQSFAPKCPHCHKVCSAAGGLINQTVSHWKCFDCNYEVDDIPAQTVQ